MQQPIVGIPGSAQNIIVNSGASLTLNSGSTITAKNITIASTGTLSMNGVANSTLNVSGNWQDNGTFNAGVGTVNFNGTTAQSINKNSGNEVVLIDYNPLDFDLDKFLMKKFKDEDIVLFYGSLQLGRKILKTKYYPGIYLTLDNYETYSYYHAFGDEILNFIRKNLNYHKITNPGERDKLYTMPLKLKIA